MRNLSITKYDYFQGPVFTGIVNFHHLVAALVVK